MRKELKGAVVPGELGIKVRTIKTVKNDIIVKMENVIQKRKLIEGWDIFSKYLVVEQMARKWPKNCSSQHECLFPEQLNEIRKASISRLLCDNGDDIFSMQPKGFQKISHESQWHTLRREGWTVVPPRIVNNSNQT
uniref:Uncharacterized protein n=2 Tax=Timema TaxID=61471 RepID=A0A7R9IFS6_9NEOP|nr:unnamed protein product [Timema bartmani]CAD7457601.1 unnamed protein product [Timema tahoe]